jgi:hypothetical protein
VGLKTMRFIALLFTALALAPALAHLLELPNKISFSREDYLTVQQIYRGWALLGFVVAGALLSNLILTIMVRTQVKAFILTLIAFLHRCPWTQLLPMSPACTQTPPNHPLQRTR